MTNEAGEIEVAMTPPRVEWEVTAACDLSCAHCYARPFGVRHPEATTAEALRHARALGSAGVRVVSLSGGEPTLRPDLPVLVEALAREGVLPTLLSHGLRLDLPLVRSLRSAGLCHVQLSLDGVGDTHDRIRRSPGAFLGVLRAASMLRSVGLPFGFTTTLLHQNLPDLETLASLVVEEGAVLWQVWLGLPRQSGPQWLSPRHVPGVLSRLESLGPGCPPLALGDNLGYQTSAERLRPIDGLGACPSAQLTVAEGGSRFGGCEAGRRVLWLRADGRVAPCPLLDEPVLGHLGIDPLIEIVARGRRALEERRRALGGACGPCIHRETCGGGCHGAALLRHGRLENPYCARVARRMAPGLGRRLARMAGGAVMAASLAAGCGAPGAPRSAPAAADARGTQGADPAVRQSVGPPARIEEDARATTRQVPPSPPASKVSPAVRPAPPGSYPRCCMMHMLVPGCQCGGPSLPPRTPTPPKSP